MPVVGLAAAENEKELARRAAQRAPTASVRAEPDGAPDADEIVHPTRDVWAPKFSQMSNKYYLRSVEYYQSQKRFRSVILSRSRGHHRIPRPKLGLGRSNNIPHFLLSVTDVTLTEVGAANFFAGRLRRPLARWCSTTRCCTRQL